MQTGRIVPCTALGLAVLVVQGAFAASPFAKSMNKVCHAADVKVARIGVSQSLYELTVNEPQLLAAGEWKLARLLKLGKAPAGAAKPFATYVALQRQIDGLESRMVSAAKHVHLSTVEQLQAQSVLLEKKQDTAARKIGAAACLSSS